MRISNLRARRLEFLASLKLVDAFVEALQQTSNRYVEDFADPLRSLMCKKSRANDPPR
jgi:hypothetical protein